MLYLYFFYIQPSTGLHHMLLLTTIFISFWSDHCIFSNTKHYLLSFFLLCKPISHTVTSSTSIAFFFLFFGCRAFKFFTLSNVILETKFSITLIFPKWNFHKNHSDYFTLSNSVTCVLALFQSRFVPSFMFQSWYKWTK